MTDLEFKAIQKVAYISIGVCPYCRGTLSDVRKGGNNIWRHCFSCNFDFVIEEDD